MNQAALTEVNTAGLGRITHGMVRSQVGMTDTADHGCITATECIAGRIEGYPVKRLDKLDMLCVGASTFHGNCFAKVGGSPRGTAGCCVVIVTTAAAASGSLERAVNMGRPASVMAVTPGAIACNRQAGVQIRRWRR